MGGGKVSIPDRWCDYRPVVTVVDVLELGPCYAGVAEFILGHGGVISAPADRFDERHIRQASRGDGSGYGYGYGYGDGYGSGYGDGYGSGYGYGYGSGDGSGDGYGYGSGYGSGDGPN
jgi:hypothetical protein